GFRLRWGGAGRGGRAHAVPGFGRAGWQVAVDAFGWGGVRDAFEGVHTVGDCAAHASGGGRDDRFPRLATASGGGRAEQRGGDGGGAEKCSSVHNASFLRCRFRRRRYNLRCRFGKGWRFRVARRTQGTAAGLDRARIAAAAVALIDRDGLERFGVRRLAEALGVDPMSIYHHIKGQAALLDAASEAVLAEVADTLEAGGDGGGDWEELARRIARAYREVAFRHPHVVPLLATRPQVSPVALSALERLVAAMRAAGLPDRVIADVPLTLFGFLNGYLLAVVGGDPGGEPG